MQYLTVWQGKGEYCRLRVLLVHFSLSAARLNAELTQFALQLMGPWDNERPITMRLALCWHQTRCPVSGVMGGVWWMAAGIYSGIRCNVFCQLLCSVHWALCFSCCSGLFQAHGVWERLGCFKEEISLSATFPFGGKSRESQRWEKSEVAKIGSLGFRSISRKREWLAGGWNRSCCCGGNPLCFKTLTWWKGRQRETQQETSLLHFVFVQGLLRVE